MKKAYLLAGVAGLSLTLLGSAPPPSGHSAPDDASILARFQELVAVDLDCAQLAAERGHSKEVRDFGAILVREHGMARQMTRDIAAQINVTLKPSTDSPQRAEHEKIQRSLRDRPDVAFDVLFVRHEVDYHKQIAELINKEWLPAVKNPDVSAFLTQVASAFEAHSKMAGELWQRLPH